MTPNEMSDQMIEEFENMILLTKNGAREAALISVRFCIMTTAGFPEVNLFWKQVEQIIESSFD
jgi:hypothetical protein